MALSESTLADNLEAMLDILDGPSPPAANDAWAEAFGEYFKDATLGPVGVTALTIDDDGKPEMAGGIGFDSGHTAAQGAKEISDGLLAFWSDMVLQLPSYFSNGLPSLIQAGVVGNPSPVATALLAAFALNQVPSITNAQVAANLAAAIHPNAGIGGSAVVVTTTTPIL